jgi:hypothetical protein
MKDLKRRLLELEVAWKALDGYAAHAAGCPTIWEAGGADSVNLIWPLCDALIWPHLDHGFSAWEP